MLICCSVKGILQTHVGVEGIIARSHLILRNRIIKRCRYLSFVREQLTQFQRGSDGVLLLGVRTALHHTLLQSAEAIADITACDIHGTEVRELYLQIT